MSDASAVKTYYDMLGVSPHATADEIKRAFRREISRYHPDKVQHLGQEFQDLAVGRAAELTRAYRVLMDAESRAAYEKDLRQGTPVPPPPPPEPPAEPPSVEPRGARASDVLIRRAALARLKSALERSFGDVESVPIPGFDYSALHKPKRGLFRKGDADLRLLARFVPVVDAAAVDEIWPLALRTKPTAEAPVCLFLMGVGLAQKEELARAIDVNRRNSRGRATGLLVVPLDVRDWEAHIPTGAPAAVRTIIQCLRNPE